MNRAPSHTDTDLCVFSVSQMTHIGDEQRRDASLHAIAERLESQSSDQCHRSFVFHNGVIYHQCSEPDGTALLLVVLKHFRSAALHKLRDLPTASDIAACEKSSDVVAREIFRRCGL